MLSIREYLQPWFQSYNRFLNGQKLSDLLQFKAQKGVGNSYVSKVFRSQTAEIYSGYEDIVKNISSPSYFTFLKDNFVRLVLLNAAQRLIAAYQAAPVMIRAGRPSSYSFLFTQIMNDGAFRGTLKGAYLGILQSSLVLWPSIYISNQYNSGYAGFLSTYMLLDLILHPLDTIKTYMYSRTVKPIGIRNIFSNFSQAQLFAGIVPKIFFNIPFATAIYATTQDDPNSWAYWLATALAFPLLNKKVWAQTYEIKYSHKISYRGVVPFILLNYFFVWKMTALYSPEKVKKIYEETVNRSIQELGHI